MLFFTRGRDVVIGPEFVRNSAPAAALQVAFDTVLMAWGSTRYRSELCAGRHVRLQRAALCALYEEGRVLGVVYLDSVPQGAGEFPSDHHRLYFQRILRHARRAEPPNPVRTYVQEALVGADVRDELERLQLEQALRAYWGNVSAVARLMHRSRDTVYMRMRRLGIDPSQFRQGL